MELVCYLFLGEELMPCVAGINSCWDACQHVLILSLCESLLFMSETTEQSGLRLALISPFNSFIWFVFDLQYLNQNFYN